MLPHGANQPAASLCLSDAGCRPTTPGTPTPGATISAILAFAKTYI